MEEINEIKEIKINVNFSIIEPPYKSKLNSLRIIVINLRKKVNYFYRYPRLYRRGTKIKIQAPLVLCLPSLAIERISL